MNIKVAHHYRNVDRARFAEVYFSDAYNQAIAPLAGLKTRRAVEERTLENGKVWRRVLMVPDIELPGPVRKLIGDAAIEYCEVSTYDPDVGEAEYHVESEAGETVDVRGVIRFLEENEGVTREIDGTVHVKLFGVGKLIEGLISREIARRYDAIHAFTQRYLDEREGE